MSHLSPEKLEELFKEWKKVKKEISSLESREQEIKDIVKDLMKEVNSNKLKGINHYVEKKSQVRTTISKKDVPLDVWDKYSKDSSCDVLYLKRYDN